MNKLSISSLSSGGIIMNYNCSSACKHCLYKCSKERDSSYINEEVLKKALYKIRSLGCYNIHLGGGEPFLNFKDLIKSVKTISDSGVQIDYVETNASWANDLNESVEKLRRLKAHGVKTILVSISPFHNEFIPFKKTKTLINAAHEAGVSVFPWLMDFYSDLDAFDSDKTHKLKEYENRFGKSYIGDIPKRYWIHYGGRAVDTFAPYKEMKPFLQILNERERCIELKDVSHFHVDLYGNYIPGLCAGLSIELKDLGRAIDEKKYPFISALFSGGVSRLYEIAKDEYGFSAKDEYFSKCHLCYDIKNFLVNEAAIKSVELNPYEYYTLG